MRKTKNRGRRSCTRRENTKRLIRPGHIDMAVDYNANGSLVISFTQYPPKYKGGHHTDSTCDCLWCGRRNNPYRYG